MSKFIKVKIRCYNASNEEMEEAEQMEKLGTPAPKLPTEWRWCYVNIEYVEAFIPLSETSFHIETFGGNTYVCKGNPESIIQQLED